MSSGYERYINKVIIIIINLTEEENSSQCLKILTQITIEDENELAEIQEVFPKKINERILRQ